MSKIILFVDSKVKDYQTLLADVSRDIEVFMLNAEQDGILQMVDTLKDRTELGSIQLISHGSNNSLYLGSTILSSDNLSLYTNALTQIGSSLSANGDILLYGCNVAQGDAGLEFINQLNAITGADIAASNDLTGNAALGGNWILETATGTIDTQTLSSTYSELLALPTAFQLFNAVLTPEEKTVFGSEQAGMIRTMADFAKAAYNLVHPDATEYVDINDNSPHATEAYNEIISHNWTPLSFSFVPPILDNGFIQYGMMNDGFYVNGNAAACVARCADAIVLSFRGTNDNGKDGVNNPYDPNNTIHPDVDQWTAMPNHYALLNPLISAFDAYVASNGISKVYVTGHSMGGTMALEYMSRHSGSQYQAVTFAASPFGDTFLGAPFRKSYSPDNRITQIEIAKDTVPFFDERVGLSSSNPRPGHLIRFAGDQTLDTPDHITKLGGFGLDYWGRTANHSMDYYRQIADSVDADSWTRILANTNTQTVLLSGQQVSIENFIVDGQLSGTNISETNGNDTLRSIDFSIVYGGKGDDWLIAGMNNTQLLGGVGNDTLQGNIGNDILNGGDGTDTGVYSGVSANYTFGYNASLITVQDTRGIEGIDILLNIEKLQFSDQTVNINVDPLRYIASNPDLLLAFGANAGAGLTHYINNGIKEGRLTNSFDPNRYLSDNPDLQQAFGNNQNLAIQHYIQFGFYEGRASTSFDPLRYIASNPDLINAFGTNVSAGLSHYINHGISEGRSINSFDPAWYLANNADLRSAFGNNERLALNHYINYGNSEGRSVDVNSDNNLVGSNFQDTINGYGGNDTIDGGSGNDILTGGIGSDIFKFTTAIGVNNIDTLVDFSVVDDTIQLDNAIFASLITIGELNADNFVISTVAIDANDYIVYNNNTGALFYDADGNSAGDAIQIALLGTGLALTHADFIVI